MSIFKQYKMIGLMTGTSMDGLDICVSKIKFFLKSINVEVIKVGYVEFPKKIKLNIENSLSLKKEDIKTCHKSLGEFMAKETHQFIKKNKISNIDAVGMHGQTIEHISGVKSLQIGDPKYLLNKLNVPIISNFRNLDIKNGGTGAPLVPFLDKILFQEEKNAVLCLNIGGISNITFLPSLESNGNIIGFDTGPGMSLIDEASKIFFNKKFDKNGTLSINGKPNLELVENWMKNKFITSSYPKSTGRKEFGLTWLKRQMSVLKKLDKKDILPTLASFTSSSIFYNCKNFTNYDKIKKIIISGGGIYNTAIMSNLKNKFKNILIYRSENFGIDSDSKEALCFALLGAAFLNNTPSNIPSVTGAKKPVVLGEILK